MANYMLDVEKQLHRQFSVAIKGYTFEFKTNYKGYVKWADRTKKIMRKRAMELCREWANFIAVEAKKRCPHYSGGLEKAIKVSGISGMYNARDYGASRMTVSVGVDGRSWSSAYDDYVIKLAADGKISDFMLASPQLAVFLHENWDLVKGKEAEKRAERKSAATGVRVGSHFLSRAYSENNDAIRRMSVEMYKNPLAERQTIARYEGLTDSLLDEWGD